MKRITLVLLFSIAFYSCNKKEELINYKEVIRPVRYYKISDKKVDDVRVFSGMAMPMEQAKLSFKIPGTIDRIYVKKGDKIKKGSLIATYDNKLTRLQLREAEVALKNIKIKKNTAESIYKRTLKLYENQSISKNDYEKSKTAFDLAKTGIETVKAKIAQIKLKLSYSRLISPASGQIAYVLQKESENIAAGYPVVVLNYGKHINVEFELPENLINSVKKDDKVSVEFESIKDKKFYGKIKEIGISPKLKTPMYPITVELDEYNEKILTGMVAKVSLDLNKTNKSKIIIPSFAVSSNNKNENFVYILEGNGEIRVAKKRIVKLGKLTDKGFEILEGLKLNEIIVTAGLADMKEGLKVKLLEGLK